MIRIASAEEEEEFRRRVLEDERRAREDKQKLAEDLMSHGTGMYETWISFAFKDPPEDLIGRIIWTVGLWGQMVLSIATFPAALAAFLIEESVQTYGMGAYMLSTAGAWDILDRYLVGQKAFIDGSRVGAKTLAGLSPVTGGAVLIYLDAAEESTAAFKAATDKRLLDAAEKDEALRDKLLADQLYGTLSIRSSPSGAQIYIDGDGTIKLTPETFKRLDVGTRVIRLDKYSIKREVMESYTFEIDVEAGRKKEIFIHIPKDVTSDEETPGQGEGTDTPKLPEFIKAEVTGDYAVDGDTFQTSTGERIRILGIDTPELGRPWADMAKEYTHSLIEDKKINLKIQTFLPIDVYGRTLAICESYKGNIAVLLLSAGLARTFIAEDATYDPTRYLEAERIAKERRIGIWGELP